MRYLTRFFLGYHVSEIQSGASFTHTSRFGGILRISEAPWAPVGSTGCPWQWGAAVPAAPLPLRWGDRFFCFFSRWWPRLARGEDASPGWSSRQQPPDLKEWVSRLRVSGTRGHCHGGFLGRAPRRQGDGTKGWLQGTIVGRLVTVPSSGQADRAPCVCTCSGWALRPGFPGPWLLVRTPPNSPLNPLLPAAYLATWPEHPSQALVSISHPGQLPLEAGLRPG